MESSAYRIIRLRSGGGLFGCDRRQTCRKGGCSLSCLHFSPWNVFRGPGLNTSFILLATVFVSLPVKELSAMVYIYSAPPNSFRLPPQPEPVNSPATPPLLSVEHLDRRYSLHRCSQGPITPDHSLRRVHFTVSVSLVM